MLLEGNWGDVNSVDSKGWTPLMRAGNFTYVIKILINQLSIENKFFVKNHFF